MIHPATTLKFIDEEMGFGVFATEFLPKGTITWVQDDLDRLITKKEFSEMSEDYKKVIEYFGFRNNAGDYVVCWDTSKYVNHSFDSNCLSTAYDFEIAIRDIQKGEQLTNDYGYLNIERPFTAKPENSKRNIVYPNDLLTYYPYWDAQLIPAFQNIYLLNQPLKNFFEEEEWELIIAKSKGLIPIDSILCNYYNSEEQI